MQKWHVELSKAALKKIKMVLRSKKVSMESKKRSQILLDIDESNGKIPESLSNIIYVDESGINRHYQREYARAKRGVRIHGRRFNRI